MFRRHMGKYLSAFAQGELSPAQAGRVAKHLLICSRCRSALDEVKWGIALAKQLPLLSAPPALANSVGELWNSGVLGERLAPTRRARWSGWQWAQLTVGCVAIVLAALIWYQRLRPLISLKMAAARVSKLEALALDLQTKSRAGAPELDFATDNPRVLRSWVMDKTGLKLELAAHQNELAEYRPRGAKIVKAQGGDIVAVAYYVAQMPVTLVTADVRTLPKKGVPSKGMFKKDIFYRLDPVSHTSLLSWTRADQSYVLASDLPDLGRTACFVCHTDPRRQELIRSVKLPSE